MKLVVSRRKTTVQCRVGPVGRCDYYWRDRSARDEKSQSIVVARIRNDNASRGPSHSSASILALFEYSEYSGSVSTLDAMRSIARVACHWVPLLGTDVGKS